MLQYVCRNHNINSYFIFVAASPFPTHATARNKYLQGPEGMRIGDRGPMGRILVRGEAGHDIVPELYPLPTEPVVDKPGKGAFFATDLDTILRSRGIETLLVCGVTTEV